MEALREMILASKRESAERVERVGQAHIPSFIVMGSRDPDFKVPEAEAQWVAQHLNGRYQMIPNAGHYPHAELPDETGAYVLSFLRSLNLQGEKARAA